jgi:hypothetical protein
MNPYLEDLDRDCPLSLNRRVDRIDPQIVRIGRRLDLVAAPPE